MTDKAKLDKPTFKSPKVFDVRRPGKAPASPTSRPVIVGHKPQAQSTQIAVSGIGEASPPLLAKEKKIDPIVQVPAAESMAEPIAQEATSPTTPAIPDPKEVEALATAALATTTEAPAAPDESPQQAEVETEPSPSPAEDTSAVSAPEEKPPAIEIPADPAVAPDKDATPLSGAIPAATEEIEPEPVIEPLFDKSGIVVSHHGTHAGGSTTKILLLLLLVLLLAAAIADLLLDAGILTLNGIPHTNFL